MSIKIKMAVSKVYEVELDIKGDDRGSLIAVESLKEVPFEIKRIYYIFGTKTDVARGFHAHKKLKQLLICVSGSVNIKCEYQDKIETHSLNSPSQGLYMEGLVWREMFDFSPDAVLLVLASDFYNESDYIRSYDDFKNEMATN